MGSSGCEAQKQEIKKAIELVEQNVDVIDDVLQMQEKRKTPREVIPKILDFSQRAIERLEEVSPDCIANAPGVYPRSLCKVVEDIVYSMKENVRKCQRPAKECYEDEKRYFESQGWWKGLSKDTREDALKKAKEDCERDQRWHCVYVADAITHEIHAHEAIPLLLSKGNRQTMVEKYYASDLYLMMAYKDLFNEYPDAAREEIWEAKKALAQAKVIYNEHERKNYVCELSSPPNHQTHRTRIVV